MKTGKPEQTTVNDSGTSAASDAPVTHRRSLGVRNIDGLDVARLREVLAYNPETGDLIWRVRTSPMCKLGGIAGKTTTDGYRRVAIDGRSYTASHLVWLHYYGVPPTGLLDHRNGERDDNRIANLRDATHSENSRNIGVRRNSSTGLKGAARFNSPGNAKKFRSTITVDGNRIHLGQFSTAEEAHAAYRKKAEELHGEFARIEWNPEEVPMTSPIAELRAQARGLSRRRPHMPKAAQPRLQSDRADFQHHR